MRWCLQPGTTDARTSFIPSVGGGDLAALGFGAIGLGGAVGAYTLAAGRAIAETAFGAGLIIRAVGVGILVGGVHELVQEC